MLQNLGAHLMPILAAEDAKLGDWTLASDTGTFKITNFLTSGANNLQTWGGIIMVILGVAAIIVAAYKLVTGLISHGKKEVNWIVTILLFVVGALFIYGGWNVVAGQIAAGMQQTVQTWGSGSATSTLLPLLFGLGL